ncbi:MAG: UDP-N-acetylmuramate dehydrogenase [Planctomycetes bacterium]|nr:UDP-N-acetylmuramate dehydrogenase [Planctomycetota bacterium]
MNIFSGLEQIVKTDIALANYTWYGVGGNADYLITPNTVEQLTDVVKRCSENSIPLRVIGEGSNLLVSDEGVKGAVIKLEGDIFGKARFEEQTVWAPAGVNLSKLVLECVRKGLGGLEALTGIPGSIGGAVRMNAGGKFGDIGAAVESVMLMDNEGSIYERAKPGLVFDYRTTNITANIILEAKLQLVESDPDQLLKTTKEIWIYKKNSQPLTNKNAGCVFKNPRALSAGAMIDRAGLKNLKIGGAEVSDKHANFIITHEGCTAADILRLIETVQQRVKESCDIELEMEIEVW